MRNFHRKVGLAAWTCKWDTSRIDVGPSQAEPEPEPVIKWNIMVFAGLKLWIPGVCSFIPYYIAE
jgi:hypothetical protein